MHHTLTIRHQHSAQQTDAFVVQRQSDGKQTDPCTLPDPRTIAIPRTDKHTLQDDLHWYLSDYLKTANASTKHHRAESLVTALTHWGEACFKALFSGRARDWQHDFSLALGGTA